MNKRLLMIFACAVLTASGQEESRKEERDPTEQGSAQPPSSSTGRSEKEAHEREKRMPGAKKLDDGSFGYAWNVGSGVSYMKMHVGKTNNPLESDSYGAAQHQVVNSLRDGGHRHFQVHNDKTGYEKQHKDYLKMSQQIVSQKNKNLNTTPTIANQKDFGMGKQELNIKDKNIRTFLFNSEQNQGIKGGYNKFHNFNTKLKMEYDNFNKDVQFSSWPQYQSHSLKELNIDENLKSVKGAESKPSNGFEYNDRLKSLNHQQNFVFGGNLDGVYKSIELPMQEGSIGRNNFFVKQKEANTHGFTLGENTLKQNEEVRSVIPSNIKSDQIIGTDRGNDAVFKYIGESAKTETDEGHKISPGEAWSSQNVFSDHQSNIEGTEHKQGSEETRENTDGENSQKELSEILYNPQTENKASQFFENKDEENIYPQIANGFDGRFVNVMHPMMNQKLINDQVERIKQIQQKVIENHFPGAGIYDTLDGNAQHGFPMQTQINVDLWKQEERNRGREQISTRLPHSLHNNRQVTNVHKERTVPYDGTTSLSYSHVRHGHLTGDLTRHNTFRNNNGPNSKFNPNQFFSWHKLPNDERKIESESHDGREKETIWRSQRNSVKSENQHQTDLQDNAFESDKLKIEESFKENDDRKGREIKSGFENEGSDHLVHQKNHATDEHTKHFYGSVEHEEIKPNHLESGYSHYHKYPQQEPQVKVITKAVPVHKELKIPVPQMVRHPILIPFPVKVLEPYPIKIPVPVTVEKTVEVPVEKVIHYPVEKPVPMKVVKEVRVPVPKPYPVKVPVYKIKYVHHKGKKHE